MYICSVFGITSPGSSLGMTELIVAVAMSGCRLKKLCAWRGCLYLDTGSLWFQGTVGMWQCFRVLQAQGTHLSWVISRYDGVHSCYSDVRMQTQEGHHHCQTTLPNANQQHLGQPLPELGWPEFYPPGSRRNVLLSQKGGILFMVCTNSFSFLTLWCPHHCPPESVVCICHWLAPGWGMASTQPAQQPAAWKPALRIKSEIQIIWCVMLVVSNSQLASAQPAQQPAAWKPAG